MATKPTDPTDPGLSATTSLTPQRAREPGDLSPDRPDTAKADPTFDRDGNLVRDPQFDALSDRADRQGSQGRQGRQGGQGREGRLSPDLTDRSPQFDRDPQFDPARDRQDRDNRQDRGFSRDPRDGNFGDLPDRHHDGTVIREGDRMVDGVVFHESDLPDATQADRPVANFGDPVYYNFDDGLVRVSKSAFISKVASEPGIVNLKLSINGAEVEKIDVPYAADQGRTGDDTSWSHRNPRNVQETRDVRDTRGQRF